MRFKLVVLILTVALLGALPAQAQYPPTSPNNLFDEIIDIFVAALNPPTNCDVSAIVGTYLINCSGSVTLPAGAPPFLSSNPLTVGYAGMGTAVTDSSGYVRAPNVCVNVGGQMMQAGVEGRAIVNPDCTGTIRYYPFGYNKQALGPAFDPNNWVLYIRFVVLNRGTVLRGMLIGQTDPQSPMPFTVVPPAPVQCELRLMNRSTPIQLLNPNFCTVPAVQ